MRLSRHTDGRVCYSRRQLGESVARAGADDQRVQLDPRPQRLCILNGADGLAPRDLTDLAVKILGLIKPCIECADVAAQYRQHVIAVFYKAAKLRERRGQGAKRAAEGVSYHKFLQMSSDFGDQLGNGLTEEATRRQRRVFSGQAWCRNDANIVFLRRLGVNAAGGGGQIYDKSLGRQL